MKLWRFANSAKRHGGRAEGTTGHKDERRRNSTCNLNEEARFVSETGLQLFARKLLRAGVIAALARRHYDRIGPIDLAG